MAKVTLKTFPNGLRMYVMPHKGTSAATLLVMYKVGSRYETKGIAGMSHFLEHMMFKGTKKRPDARMIARELDGLGAEFNAFTSKDLTGYYIKSAEQHFTKSFEILSDMLINSTFLPRQVKRERTVILEEMRMYLDNPVMYISDLFEQRLFGDTDLGREIIGFKKSILATTSDNLKKYFDLYYHPSNMIVVATGAVTPTSVERLTNKYFSKLKRKRRLPYLNCSLVQSEPEVTLVSRKTEQAQIAIGFPAYSYTHPRLTALEVLHGVMGSGMSARLFEIIREKMGLAYSIRTGVTSYEDHGAFYAKGGMDAKKTIQAISQILKEFKRIKRELITKEELQRAQQVLNGSLALELEQSDNYARWIAGQALFRPKIETVAEVQERINSVTREDVREVAREIMSPEKLNLAIVGPYKSEAPFMKALRSFS